ncbi:uncharacterized protein LOC105172664 isoform X2 [Sesamum indicum]|uniref:Uncharacterized protein LOC105172664 isoform X2 n=1 Tax=Sesamum indicum TaxID=4182 RepID=A0A8M8V2B8_SESIN|nr:uncharacterized protein LOC105172664 isoform X2 [Sesamum indicum]
MDKFLDDLFAKRGSVREGALSSIVDGLNLNYLHQFAGKNFATLLYRCLNSFKKGSSKEIVLASRALGLLSITVGCGDNAHELYKESLPLISQALRSRTESLLLSVIDCLAIATFVGANDFEETEAAMQIIWHFINLKPGDNVVVSKQPASVLSAAISTWSLLLTTVNGWNLNHNYWRGAIPYFLNLLEVDDQSVCMVAGQAIALICEMGFLEKFAGNLTTDEISLNEKGKNIKDQDYSIQELQEIVSNHAKRVLRQNSLQSAATKTVNGWSNFSQNFLEALEDGRFHEASLKIGKHRLQLHSLSQLLQVNFIKRFLGRGFVPHMVENEFLHDVFNFTPRKQESGVELYSSEREEAVVHLFVPETRQRDGEDDFGAHRPQRSAYRKAKTQLLNKQRMLKGEELRPYDD